LSAVAGSARAQDSEPPEYRTLVKQGVQEFDRGNWPEAYAAFKRANDLLPNARTQRSLGFAAFEARRYALALGHLEAALVETRRALTPQQREEVAPIIERAKRYVARLKIAVTPDTATVQIDTGPQVALPASGELLLDPGQHDVRFAADGHADERVRLVLETGEQRELQVALRAAGAEPSAAAPPPEQAAPPADAAREPAAASPSMVGPYIVLAAGGALLISAAVTGLLARSAADELEEGCEQNVCDPELESAKKRGETLRLSTNVLLGIGGAAVAVGGVYWLLQRSSAPSEHRQGASVACGPDGCMAGYRANF
jgi:hypothetical protein